MKIELCNMSADFLNFFTSAELNMDSSEMNCIQKALWEFGTKPEFM